MLKNALGYQVRLRNGDWEPLVYDGTAAGTIAGIDGIRIVGTGTEIQYRAHVENFGWLEWVGEGEVAGSPDRRQVEALQFHFIDGNVEGKDHVWGRVVSAKIGLQPVLLPFIEYGEHNYLGTTAKHLQLERLQLWKSLTVEGDASSLPFVLDALAEPHPTEGAIYARWGGMRLEIPSAI